MTSHSSLPPGYRHPHASEQARAIAERGMALRGLVGSQVHGVSVADTDDRDEMGLCFEPLNHVLGLAKVPRGIDGTSPQITFEQYERHTAWDRDGGVRERSGAGDLDVVVYSARKWARLALAGNPTVLVLLFVADRDVVFSNELGDELRANAHRFVSRGAGARFLGYLRGQKRGVSGARGTHTNRPELIERYGYDTKFAGHAVRLGIQGAELLSTGRISLPMNPPERQLIIDIREGRIPLAETLQLIDHYEEQLCRYAGSTSLPAEPDRPWVDDWLVRGYLSPAS